MQRNVSEAEATSSSSLLSRCWKKKQSPWFVLNLFWTGRTGRTGRTKLIFKLDFPGNSCRAAVPILAMFVCVSFCIFSVCIFSLFIFFYFHSEAPGCWWLGGGGSISACLVSSFPDSQLPGLYSNTANTTKEIFEY